MSQTETSSSTPKKRFNVLRVVKYVVLLGPAVWILTGYMTQAASGFWASRDGHVSVVRLVGEIGANAEVAAGNYSGAIGKAFKDRRSIGVILLINSPGGSPVQSELIRAQLDRMQTRFPEKPLVVVAEDMVGSGSYLVASGADKIYVQPSTIVGSIGVIMQSWSAAEALKKIGLKRITITAGQHKDRLNMFEPTRIDDMAKAMQLTRQIHANFIDAVVAGRGDRLSSLDGDLFTGDIWTGREAIALGLADEIGGIRVALDEEFGTLVVKDYTPKPSLIDQFGSGVGRVMVRAINDMALSFQ